MKPEFHGVTFMFGAIVGITATPLMFADFRIGIPFLVFGMFVAFVILTICGCWKGQKS